MEYSFDNATSPCIEIDVFGWNEAIRHRIPAILDTGYTGFLLLPIIDAFVIGPILDSTLDVTLADGSTYRKLACLGGIHFQGQSQPGLILLEEQGTEALVGMEFLRTFSLLLTLDAAAGTLRLEA